jgi:hypothetical protein
MSIYRQAPAEVVALVQEVLSSLRKDLVEVGVTLGCRFAHAPRNETTNEPKGPALKHHGYPAAAVIRVVSQKDRVAGLPDALIDFDGDRYDDFSEEEKRALIDHELTHLELLRDEEGQPKLDDCFRPRLRLRPHDAEIGVFYDVVERHGPAALETQNYLQMHQVFTQKLLPWG